MLPMHIRVYTEGFRGVAELEEIRAVRAQVLEGKAAEERIATANGFVQFVFPSRPHVYR